MDEDYATEVRITIDVDLESGEYSILFRDLSGEGKSIDYTQLMELINRVLKDTDNRIDTVGEA